MGNLDHFRGGVGVAAGVEAKGVASAGAGSAGREVLRLRVS